jgi:hypothetical protein
MNFEKALLPRFCYIFPLGYGQTVNDTRAIHCGLRINFKSCGYFYFKILYTPIANSLIQLLMWQ